MKNSIKVSIIVPIYNIEAYVDKCIRSITEQTYGNIEIILVDDGSTDKSGSICEYWGKNDNRILVLHKKNGGLVSARKAGIACASGDYVVSVDGDDWINMSWIGEFVDAIKETNADIIYRDGILRDNDGDIFNTSMNLCKRMYKKDEIHYEMIPQLLQFKPGIEKIIKLNSVSWAYKVELVKEQIKRVKDVFTTNEDLVLATYCIFNAESIFVTLGGEYHYIQRVDSMSFSNVDMDIMRVLHGDVLEFLYEKKVSSSVIKIYKDLFNVNLIRINYAALLDLTKDSLPFFPKVKKYSRIVIYGAGRVGRHIMEALSDNTEYNIVAVVDSAPEKYADKTILHIDEIKFLDFDYVLIASTVSQHINSMAERLKILDVDERKIAIIEHQDFDI